MRHSIEIYCIVAAVLGSGHLSRVFDSVSRLLRTCGEVFGWLLYHGVSTPGQTTSINTSVCVTKQTVSSARVFLKPTNTSSSIAAVRTKSSLGWGNNNAWCTQNPLANRLPSDPNRCHSHPPLASLEGKEREDLWAVSLTTSRSNSQSRARLDVWCFRYRRTPHQILAWHDYFSLIVNL